jgi:hypothetical protein
MGWQMIWPKCTHVPGPWDQQTFGKGGNRWWRYRTTRCTRCDRPMVAFAPNFPEEDKTHTRRHVAWWALDKEGEHASNTVVVPWETSTSANGEAA